MVTNNRMPDVEVNGDVESMAIEERLVAMQFALKVPKGQENKFGGYNYRSAADIEAALKPLLLQYNCTLTANHTVYLVGERYYVKAVVTLTGGGGSVSAEASAREPESQKGMVDPQITGSASSYAKKYALGNLFAIDNSKDEPDRLPPPDGNSRSNGSAPLRRDQLPIPGAATKPQEDCFHKILGVLRSVGNAPDAADKLRKYGKVAEERFGENSLTQPQIVHIRAEVDRQLKLLAGEELPVSQTVKDMVRNSSNGAGVSKTENGEKSKTASKSKQDNEKK